MSESEPQDEYIECIERAEKENVIKTVLLIVCIALACVLFVSGVVNYMYIKRSKRLQKKVDLLREERKAIGGPSSLSAGGSGVATTEDYFYPVSLTAPC